MNKRNYEKKHIVSSYAHSLLQTPEERILEKYRENILDKRVLDIGCGAGRTTSYLNDLSKSYTGIDYSFEMIEMCRKRFEHVSFIHGDVRNMNMIKDKSCDFVIFAYNGLDSISHEGRLMGLREINRVLCQNGLFVFSAHNRNHRYAITYPGFAFSTDPHILLKNIIKFIKSILNHTRQKKKQQFENEYAIINDRAHNYSMLTYYIDKKSQKSQLREVGFDIVEMYDTSGNVLEDNDYDGNSAWIYYVAQKL
ncbi:MAG: class I SAM-dependent methyltransferase [Candidatus Scalindua sp.]|nr:class I SAM-dependent methyltransferase [Candidatus Scalindua sp.]